jgi:large subunit ribosomal protein L10
MNKAEKVQVVESLKKTFSESGSLILVSFQGVNVPDITQLRGRIRESDSGYEVVKNTLALRAAEGTPVGQVSEHFTGPTAVAYTRSDPVSLAKILKEFVKSHQGMAFKGGVLDGRAIDDRQVESLAELPSREELLSKLLFLLNAPLTRLASALQSPVRNLAVVLNQVAEKRR